MNYIKQCMKRFGLIIFLFLLTFSDYTYPETAPTNIVFGCILNRSSRVELSHLESELIKKKNFKWRPDNQDVILDTLNCQDSFPSEDRIRHAKDLNAKQLIWGSVDSNAQGFSLTLNILKLSDGSESSIRVVLLERLDRVAIAEILEQKLWAWFRRMEMSQLIISSLPSGAAVLIDSTQTGQTPFETLLEPGTYRMQVTLNDHLPFLQTITLLPGNSYQYSIPLLEKNPGRRYRVPGQWIAASLCSFALCGLFQAGYVNALSDYHALRPPADFNAGYNRVRMWEISRDVSITASLVVSAMTIKKIFFWK